MLSPDRFSDLAPLSTAAADYDVVRRAIAHIRGTGARSRRSKQIAEAAGVTPTELHHLFRRWAGLTPKAFLQALTLDSARKLLRDSASVLDATYEVGLSGPGRLHDLFVTHEAMSPGEWKSGGEGLTISLWLSSVAVRHRAGDGDRARPCGPRLRRPRRGNGRARRHARPLAEGELRRGCRRAPRRSRAASSIKKLWRPDQPLRVVLIGTDFEVRVWETLLRIPMGRATTYSDIAGKIGTPKAARAVGAAVGKNPISLRGALPPRRSARSGELTGYHWGMTRKRAMLGWEAGEGRGVAAVCSAPHTASRPSSAGCRSRNDDHSRSTGALITGNDDRCRSAVR